MGEMGIYSKDNPPWLGVKMVPKINKFAWLSWGNKQSILGVVGELLGNSRSLDILDTFHENDYNF